MGQASGKFRTHIGSYKQRKRPAKTTGPKAVPKVPNYVPSRSATRRSRHISNSVRHRSTRRKTTRRHDGGKGLGSRSVAPRDEPLVEDVGTDGEHALTISKAMSRIESIKVPNPPFADAEIDHGRSRAIPGQPANVLVRNRSASNFAGERQVDKSGKRRRTVEVGTRSKRSIVSKRSTIRRRVTKRTSTIPNEPVAIIAPGRSRPPSPDPLSLPRPSSVTPSFLIAANQHPEITNLRIPHCPTLRSSPSLPQRLEDRNDGSSHIPDPVQAIPIVPVLPQEHIGDPVSAMKEEFEEDDAGDAWEDVEDEEEGVALGGDAVNPQEEGADKGCEAETGDRDMQAIEDEWEDVTEAMEEDVVEETEEIEDANKSDADAPPAVGMSTTHPSQPQLILSHEGHGEAFITPLQEVVTCVTEPSNSHFEASSPTPQPPPIPPRPANITTHQQSESEDLTPSPCPTPVDAFTIYKSWVNTDQGAAFLPGSPIKSRPLPCPPPSPACDRPQTPATTVVLPALATKAELRPISPSTPSSGSSAPNVYSDPNGGDTNRTSDTSAFGNYSEGRRADDSPDSHLPGCLGDVDRKTLAQRLLFSLDATEDGSVEQHAARARKLFAEPQLYLHPAPSFLVPAPPPYSPPHLVGIQAEVTPLVQPAALSPLPKPTGNGALLDVETSTQGIGLPALRRHSFAGPATAPNSSSSKSLLHRKPTPMSFRAHRKRGPVPPPIVVDAPIPKGKKTRRPKLQGTKSGIATDLSAPPSTAISIEQQRGQEGTSAIGGSAVGEEDQPSGRRRNHRRSNDILTGARLDPESKAVSLGISASMPAFFPFPASAFGASSLIDLELQRGLGAIQVKSSPGRRSGSKRSADSQSLSKFELSPATKKDQNATTPEALACPVHLSFPQINILPPTPVNPQIASMAQSIPLASPAPPHSPFQFASPNFLPFHYRPVEKQAEADDFRLGEPKRGFNAQEIFRWLEGQKGCVFEEC